MSEAPKKVTFSSSRVVYSYEPLLETPESVTAPERVTFPPSPVLYSRQPLPIERPFPNTRINPTGAYRMKREDAYLIQPYDGGSFSLIKLAHALEDVVNPDPRHEPNRNEHAFVEYQEEIMEHMRHIEVKNPSSIPYMSFANFS